MHCSEGRRKCRCGARKYEDQTAESCDGKRNGKNEDASVDIEDRPRVGIIGMTPQDVSDLKAADKIRKVYADQGLRAICYGMGRRTGRSEKGFSGSEKCGRISGGVKSSAVSAKEVRNAI